MVYRYSYFYGAIFCGLWMELFFIFHLQCYFDGPWMVLFCIVRRWCFFSGAWIVIFLWSLDPLFCTVHRWCYFYVPYIVLFVMGPRQCSLSWSQRGTSFSARQWCNILLISRWCYLSWSLDVAIFYGLWIVLLSILLLWFYFQAPLVVPFWTIHRWCYFL